MTALDVSTWLSTIEDPAHWAIIKVSSVVPTISLLSDQLRSAVQDLASFPARPGLRFSGGVAYYIWSARFTSQLLYTGSTLGRDIISYTDSSETFLKVSVFLVIACHSSSFSCCASLASWSSNQLPALGIQTSSTSTQRVAQTSSSASKAVPGREHNSNLSAQLPTG